MTNNKICPKCGNLCDIGDLYCLRCNCKFNFNITNADYKDEGYKEKLKQNVERYTTEYHKYGVQYKPEEYSDIPQSNNSSYGWITIIFIVVVVIFFVFLHL